MIDDYAKVKELMREMEAQLPISVRPTTALVRRLRQQGAQIVRDQELRIQDVFYAGDEGGILCAMALSEDAKEMLVVSITHLQVDPDHPLAQEIRDYQRERTIKIARSGGSAQPSSFSIRPRQKRKKRRH